VTGRVLGRSLGVVTRVYVVSITVGLATLSLVGCGGASRPRYLAARQSGPMGITPQIAACQRATKLDCNPQGGPGKPRLAPPDPTGRRLLTGQEVISRFGGHWNLRKNETVEAVRLTYGQLHAANPALASASRLLVNPRRMVWAITWHFSPPVPYQPCRYESCPPAAPIRTILLSATSTVVDALTGRTTDSCTGCTAIPEHGALGRITGSLGVCCNAHGRMPQAGIVVVRRIGGGARVIGVNRTGRFSLALPAGRYEALGGIPRLGWRLGRCRLERPSSSAPPASPIEIRPNRTTRASIICQGR
jgi:hypothetical protein